MSYCQCPRTAACRSIIVQSKRYERLALSATCKNLQADSNAGVARGWKSAISRSDVSDLAA